MAMTSIASTAGGGDAGSEVCAKCALPRALRLREDAGLSGLDASTSKARILSKPAATVGGGGGVAAANRMDVSTEDVEEGAECLGGRLGLCGVRPEVDAPGESNPGDSPVGSRSRTKSSARSGDRRERTTQKLRPASVSIAALSSPVSAGRRGPDASPACVPNRANATLPKVASSTPRAVSSSAKPPNAVPGVRVAPTSFPGASASAARATTPQGRHERAASRATSRSSSAAVAPPTSSQVSYRPLRSL